jgi:hypothetical protein
MHATDKEVTWTGIARLAGGQLEAVVATDVTMQDFNITPPTAPIVQTVDTHVHLDLHLVAVQQPS